MVDVRSQNPQIRVLMWSNKNPNIFEGEFLIWSNKDPKIKVRYAQVEILNELDLKSIWGGESQPLRIRNLFFKSLTKAP
jgi:hypothetical protein